MARLCAGLSLSIKQAAAASEAKCEREEGGGNVDGMAWQLIQVHVAYQQFGLAGLRIGALRVLSGGGASHEPCT